MMASTARHSDTDGSVTVSIRMLLFVVFVFACAARWVAHYGPGTAIVLCWATVVGACIGGTVALLSYLTHKCASKRPYEPSRLLACLLAGATGGFIGGSIGFAAAATGRIDAISIDGLWFKSVLGGPLDATDITAVIGAFVIIPSFGLATANALACAVQNWRQSPMRYLSIVGVTTGLLIGTIAGALLIAAVVMPRPQAESENMNGLVFLAAPMWFAVGAAAGSITGLATAGVWLWSRHAQHNKLSAALLWLVCVLAVLTIAEVGLHGFRFSFVAQHDAKRESTFAPGDNFRVAALIQYANVTDARIAEALRSRREITSAFGIIAC